MKLELKRWRVHPYLVFATPFGILLVAISFLGFRPATITAASAIAGGAVLALGLSVLLSCAFSVWGTVSIERVGNQVIVRRSLGPVSKSSEFFVADVRSVERHTPPPYALIWPGSAGPHIHVHLKRRQRAVSIAAGLNLDEERLKAIEELVCSSE